MIITSITQQKKDTERVNIFIDYEYKFSLTKDQLIQFGLHKNKEIIQSDLEEYLNASRKGKELTNAIKLIASRPRSEKEIFEYLKFKRNLDENEVKEIISTLVSKKYINDQYFSDWFVEQRKNNKKYGVNKIKAQLVAKGISQDIMKSSLKNINQDDQLEKVLMFLEKEVGENKDIDYYAKAKLTRKLASRGFGFDLIKQGFKKYLE